MFYAGPVTFKNSIENNDDQCLVKNGDGESMSLYVPRHMICGKGRCCLTGRKPLNLSLVIEAPFSFFFVSFL